MPLFIFNILVAVCLSYLVLAEPHQTLSDWVKGVPEQVSQLTMPNQPSSPEISAYPSVEAVAADLAPVQEQEEESSSDPVVRDVQQALQRVEEKAMAQIEMGQASQNTVAADQADLDLSDAGEGAAVAPTTPRFMSAQERQIALAALIEDLQLFALDKAY